MSYRYNCRSLAPASAGSDGNAINVAMTLDAAYLRGSIAAILSVLQHSLCSENIAFHFVASSAATADLHATIAASFPYLRFQIYPFDDSAAAGLISTTYPCNYLAELLPSCLNKIVYSSAPSRPSSKIDCILRRRRQPSSSMKENPP